MEVYFSSGEARALLARDYSESNNSISGVEPSDNVSSLSWWVASERLEGVYQPRKLASVRFYLHLAAASDVDIPEFTFPAKFEFSDGVLLRPDKGLIKALLAANLLMGVEQQSELFFGLNQRGIVWLNSSANTEDGSD